MENIKTISIRIRFLYQSYCLQMSTSRTAGTPTGGFIYNFYRCLFGTILSHIFRKDIAELKEELIEVFGERPDRSLKSDLKNVKPYVKVLLSNLRNRNCSADSELIG